MFSIKLSQDFKIKVQHQNFANNIKIQKEKEDWNEYITM